MKLTFLGTRGYIEAVTDEHRMHTTTLVTYRGRCVRIDCGEDWLRRCGEVRQQAIFITHCHPDHAFGLREGAPCPVYAPPEAVAEMAHWPIADLRVIDYRESVTLGGITMECFDVQHSTTCPAAGYRVSAGTVTVFYAPDLVYIRDREGALQGCKVYIGDGASIDRNFVRKHKDSGELIGHAPVRTQLTWCRKLGVPRMIVTHCGSQIVKGGAEAVSKIEQYARERGVQVEVATDGQEVVLR
ncbi:MAG: MBL fold metallo-hydrolase [Armatimonadota bacterium]